MSKGIETVTDFDCLGELTDFDSLTALDGLFDDVPVILIDDKEQ